MKINFKTLIIVFLVALLGAGIGTYAILSTYTANNKLEHNSVVINEVEYSDIQKNDYTKAIEKAYDSVVEINCITIVSNPSYFFIDGGTSEATSSGSGVIFSEDGYIVTNNHVIENAKEGAVKVKLYNGESYDARIIGTDSRTDLAVLKIDANNLEYASFVDSSKLLLGQDVIAIGNPLGLGISCSNGIVSALEKEIYINKVYLTVLQTNAAVNAGNSGGGLFDINGNLVGIVNAKKSSDILSSSASIEGMGYAIPANTVTYIIDQLVENGYVKDRASLGIRVYTSNYYQVDGVIISEVIQGGGAQVAGLQANDIIVKIDDTDVALYADLSKALDAKNVGDKVKVTVLRNNEQKEFEVLLQASTSSK